MPEREHGASLTVTAGYADPRYARAFDEFGSPCLLEQSDGWILKRQIGRSVDYDAMGLYPLFTCRNWPLSRIFIHYLVGKPDGVEHFTETHDMGLFTDAQYAEAFRNAGLNEVRHDAKGLFGRGMYTGTRTS